jgi:hypothetical protein
MNKHLIKPTQQDINISINNPINETNIETFTVKKARLSNSSLQSTTSDSMTFNLQYIGYINKK